MLFRSGRRTVALEHPPSVISYANIGGKLEGEGPLREHFDELNQDSFFGEKTWEKAESAMQKRVLQRALDQIKLKPGDLDYIFAGDLLNQCIGSSFGLREFGVPFYGLYGACSTMGESLSLAAMAIDGGFAEKAAAMTSSHFCTAERQYRMPVPYGNQRTPTAQWTATAAGCTILASEGPGPYITHITLLAKALDHVLEQPGRVRRVAVNRGVRDKHAFFLRRVRAPRVVQVDVVPQVFRQDRAVQRADDLHIQAAQLFQQRLHLHAVFADDIQIVAAG